MTRLGGPPEVTRFVVEHGGKPGPRSIWVGPWVLKSGYAQYRPFFEKCLTDGVEPLVLCWWAGDDIGLDFLRTGVKDKHQGVWKTRAMGVEALGKVMAAAKGAGVVPLVCVEPEFNKSDAMGVAGLPLLVDWLEQLRAVVVAGGGKAVFSPGGWGDVRRTTELAGRHAKACDLIGLQALKFPPRHSRADYLGSVDGLVKGFASIRSVTGQKPAIVYDCAWSTYAGGATGHPFEGGDGKAFEDEQAAVFAQLVQRLPEMQAEAVVVRALKDDPSFAVGNFGGWAERFLGLVRADGSVKPAYGNLVALALSSVDQGEGLEKLEGKMLELEAELEGLGVDVQALRLQLGKLEERVERAGLEMGSGE